MTNSETYSFNLTEDPTKAVLAGKEQFVILKRDYKPIETFQVLVAKEFIEEFHRINLNELLLLQEDPKFQLRMIHFRDIGFWVYADFITPHKSKIYVDYTDRIRKIKSYKAYLEVNKISANYSSPYFHKNGPGYYERIKELEEIANT